VALDLMKQLNLLSTLVPVDAHRAFNPINNVRSVQHFSNDVVAEELMR